MTGGSSERNLIGLGLFCFLLLSVWFIVRSQPSKEHFPPLSSFSPRPTGALALFRLLEESGMAPQRWLESVYNYPADGTIVLLDHSAPDPTLMLLGGLDAKALSQWLKKGGRLVYFASNYSFNADALRSELLEQSGSELFEADFPWPQAKDAGSVQHAPARLVFAEAGQAALSSTPLQRSSHAGEVYAAQGNWPAIFSGIDRIEFAGPESIVEPAGAVLLEAGNPPEALVVWQPVGSGEILWIYAPELASNSWIQRQDNHRLLLQLLDYAGRDRKLYFDEYFHGYRPDSANLVSLLLNSPGGRLLLIALGLCALACAGAAIQPAHYAASLVPPRRQSSEMVLAQGNMYQRAGLLRPIAMHLLDGLRQSVRRYERWGSPPDNAQLSRWLEGSSARGLQPDPLLVQFVSGRAAISTPRQLLHFARACDSLRTRLGG